MGNNPICVLFMGLYLLFTVCNAPIASFCSLVDGEILRDFHLFRYLNDRKAEAVTSLTQLLDSVNFSNRTDKRLWKLENYAKFSTKSSFTHLFQSLNLPSFAVANFIWKSKVPSKIKALMWVVILGKVNTNDML